MKFLPLRSFVFAGVWLVVSANGQPPAARVFSAQNFEDLPRPAVPADPLELVTSAAQTVQTPEQRLAATALLTKARELSNIRAQPYYLKTVFTSAGNLPSDGSWTLEDISPGRGVYRWSAQGPGYSVVNLYPSSTREMVYSSQPGAAIPLRLAQVRAAIFFVNPPMGPQASVRVGAGYLNGAPQSCVMTVTGAGGRMFSGPRNWEEEEYCVDSNTGLLSTYSPAPGLYVRYDYTAAKQFHGKIIPGSFTITEAGRTILEARSESATDPPSAQSALFSTAGLTAAGVGRVMNGGGIRSRSFIPLMNPLTKPASGVQVVVLHGNLSPDGRLNETEILASTDSSLNQTALERASLQMKVRLGGSQPGATPQSQEVFFTMEFAR
jgi:hypothetical protein